MKNYAKRPVVIQAEQWFGVKAVAEARIMPLTPEDTVCDICGKPNNAHGSIKTLEGDMRVCPGDWIIRGIKGEYYSCKPDIFEATYEICKEDQ